MNKPVEPVLGKAMRALASHTPMSNRWWVRAMAFNKGPWKKVDRWCEKNLEGEGRFGRWALLVGLMCIATNLINTRLLPVWLPEADLAWAKGMVLFIALGLLLRPTLVAFETQRLSAEVLETLQGWMTHYPQVASSVAQWITPTTVLRWGDYKAIRRAVRAQVEAAGQGWGEPGFLAAGMIHSWLKTLQGWINPSARHLAASASSRPTLTDEQVNLEWSRNQAAGRYWLNQKRVLQSGIAAWPAELTTREVNALQKLQRWRAGLPPGLAPALSEKRLWVKHLERQASHTNREGTTWWHAWFKEACFHGVRAFLMLGLLLWGGAKMLVFQFAYFGISSPEPRDKIPGWYLWLGEKMIWLGHHWWAVGACMGALMAVSALQEGAPLRKLRHLWWGLPLSTNGRNQLERLFIYCPTVAGPVLAHMQVEPTQADLAFARRAASKLRRFQLEVVELQQIQEQAKAIEDLPAIAEFRARQKATQLELAWAEETASAVRPRPRL